MSVTVEIPEMAESGAEPARVGFDDLAGGRVAVFTEGSPAKAGANEDAVAAIPCGSGRAVLAVADGVGGERRGAEASTLAVATLTEAVAAGAAAGESLRVAILDGFERANQRVLERGGGATTLAVLEIDDGHVRPYHAGDSVILVVGQRGKVKYRSLSHGPVAYAVEAGLLDDAEALHHDDLHLVSNVLGSADMRIEIGPRRRLAPRDTALLASDGLADNLYLDEIVQAIRCGALERSAPALIDLARERMATPVTGRPHKPDDLSVVLYRPGA